MTQAYYENLEVPMQIGTIPMKTTVFLNWPIPVKSLEDRQHLVLGVWGVKKNAQKLRGELQRVLQALPGGLFVPVNEAKSPPHGMSPTVPCCHILCYCPTAPNCYSDSHLLPVSTPTSTVTIPLSRTFRSPPPERQRLLPCAEGGVTRTQGIFYMHYDGLYSHHMLRQLHTPLPHGTSPTLLLSPTIPYYPLLPYLSLLCLLCLL